MFVFEFTSPKMPLISYFFFTNVSSDFLIKFVLTKKVYCCIKDACHFLSEGTSNTLNKVKSFQLSQHLITNRNDNNRTLWSSKKVE